MSQSFHSVQNNAFGTVQNNPLAIGGTNLIVNSGLDTKLNGLAFPYWLTLYGAGLDPSTDSGMEIVAVTARPSPNNYTITRAQQSTAASAHAQNDNIALLWTRGNSDEIDTNVNNVETELNNGIAALKTGIQNQTYSYALDSSVTPNTITVSYIPTPAYTTGMRIAVKVANTNSGSTTVNVNGLGAKTIKRQDTSTNLASGDIVVGQIIDLEYDGTNFQLQTQVNNVPPPQIILPAGESITAGAQVSGGYYQADGGITFDAKLAITNTASTISQAFTVGNNSNRILLVSLSSGNITVNSITYGGAAMTQAVSGGDPNGFTRVYYLVAPATGSNTFAITFAAPTTYAVGIYSYYGAKQTGQPDATANTSTASPAALAITSVLDGSLIFGAAGFETGGSIPSSSSGFSNNATFIGSATRATMYTGDIGVNVTPGIQTLTISPNASATCWLAFVSIAPATAPTYGYIVNASANGSSAYTHPTTTNYRAIAYIGVALNSVSVTQNCTVQLTGIVTNQSGLVPLQQYYLGNTNGTLSLTPGAVTRKVGISISATAQDITNIW